MPLELLHIRHNIGDVIDCAVCCTGLQSQAYRSIHLICIDNSQAAWQGAAKLGMLCSVLTGSSKGVKLMAQQWKGRRLNGRWLLSLAPPHSSRHSVAVTYLHAAQPPCQRRDTHMRIAHSGVMYNPPSVLLLGLVAHEGCVTMAQNAKNASRRSSLTVLSAPDAACQESVLTPFDHV